MNLVSVYVCVFVPAGFLGFDCQEWSQRRCLPACRECMPLWGVPHGTMPMTVVVTTATSPAIFICFMRFSNICGVCAVI